VVGVHRRDDSRAAERRIESIKSKQ